MWCGHNDTVITQVSSVLSRSLGLGLLTLRSSNNGVGHSRVLLLFCCCWFCCKEELLFTPRGNFFSMLHCCCYNVWRNYFLIKDNDLLDVLCPSRLISYWTLIFVRQYLKYTCQILWFETFSITTTKIGVAFNGKIIQNKKILSSSEYRSIQMHLSIAISSY